MSTRVEAVPMDLEGANEFVERFHRHHTPVVGHKFSIGAAVEGVLVGVVIVGRPVSRHRDDGETLEVTRLATDGTKNACSFLYGAAARAAFAQGFRRIGTYIRQDEPGTSLKAAGWRMIGETPGRSWSVPSRPRKDKTDLIPRLLFERATKCQPQSKMTGCGHSRCSKPKMRETTKSTNCWKPSASRSGWRSRQSTGQMG